MHKKRGRGDLHPKGLTSGLTWEKDATACVKTAPRGLGQHTNGNPRACSGLQHLSKLLSLAKWKSKSLNHPSKTHLCTAVCWSFPESWKNCSVIPFYQNKVSKRTLVSKGHAFSGKVEMCISRKATYAQKGQRAFHPRKTFLSSGNTWFGGSENN